MFCHLPFVDFFIYISFGLGLEIVFKKKPFEFLSHLAIYLIRISLIKILFLSSDSLLSNFLLSNLLFQNLLTYNYLPFR